MSNFFGIPFPTMFKIYPCVNLQAGFKKSFRKSNKPVIVFHTANDNICNVITEEFLNKYMLEWRVSLNKDFMQALENNRVVGIAIKVNRSENMIIVLGTLQDSLTIALRLTK